MAALVGSVQGGIQASSRGYFAKIIPQEKAGEFFGLFNTFGKAGAFMGPLLGRFFLTSLSRYNNGSTSNCNAIYLRWTFIAEG